MLTRDRSRTRRRLVLGGISVFGTTLLFTASAYAQTSPLRIPTVAARTCSAVVIAPSTDRVMRRVETGIMPALTGSTTQPRTLAERMRELKVPGVSVALITRGRIAWTRGWGRSRRRYLCTSHVQDILLGPLDQQTGRRAPGAPSRGAGQVRPGRRRQRAPPTLASPRRHSLSKLTRHAASVAQPLGRHRCPRLHGVPAWRAPSQLRPDPGWNGSGQQRGRSPRGTPWRGLSLLRGRLYDRPGSNRGCNWAPVCRSGAARGPHAPSHGSKQVCSASRTGEAKLMPQPGTTAAIPFVAVVTLSRARCRRPLGDTLRPCPHAYRRPRGHRGTRSCRRASDGHGHATIAARPAIGRTSPPAML